MTKLRLDQLLVQKGLADSRTKAQAVIMAGNILVNEQKITKSGTLVPQDAVIRLLGDTLPYVSRGGLKLAGALRDFQFDPRGLLAVDIGASTGGFTDCLLQHGVKQVIAIDVGFNQLAWKVRNDSRVKVIEKYNFRYIDQKTFEDLSGFKEVDLAVIDVSFISLDKILPPLYNILREGGTVISLVKPQFEAGREQVGKGGIIVDPQVHEEVMQKVKELAQDSGYLYLADTVSQIKGTDGNKEYFIFLRKPNA
jgi:23S rRNA (cytidine1920-2'-O)/16S rRNA (cytidine1409-2'-O)-methyltransferase